MKKNVFIISVIMLFVLTSIGCEYQQKSFPEESFVDQSDVDDFTAKRKADFEALTYEEQLQKINTGNFANCAYVETFCRTYPETEGCIKYCEGKWN